jgi:hypothetical protein
MDHLEAFRAYARQLFQCNKDGFIFIDESGVESNSSNAINITEKLQSTISIKILQYYKAIKSHENIWTYKKNKEIRGFINVLPLVDSMKDDFMKDFRMLDMFLPEACVGY